MKPNREIPIQIINSLYQAASKDLRVGQFMECIKSECERQGVDFFNVENDKLATIMEEWMKKNTI